MADPASSARRSFANRPSASRGDRGGPARPVGDLVSGALRSLGVPSRAASRRLFDAWARVAEPAWAGRAAPSRIVGGTLVVAVSSAPLREELAQFHATRLLEALRKALATEAPTALRFECGTRLPQGERAPRSERPR